MTNILKQIISYKKQEVAKMEEITPLAILKKQVEIAPPVRGFLAALQQSPKYPSLIAELKKASPSRGVIKPNFDPVAIAQSYERGGAACLSVLTDEKFFQGSFNNLKLVRGAVNLPLLCKEFIIDPYQIFLARTMGADAVLLIAAILTDTQLEEFLQITNELKMTALVEVHSLAELDRVLKLHGLQLLGINNRNLHDFTIDIHTTAELLQQRQKRLQDLQVTVVSESGLYTQADLSLVAKAGARAVLIGESLVKQNNIEQAVGNLFAC
jgi:indole-3-glycerol phosphate synthase